VDKRLLRHFINLADTLHFGKASTASHVSTSALSRSIQQLEAEVGVALFTRDNRSVALTREGRLFLPYAREALAQWEQIRNTLMAGADELHGEVSMYCSVTASYSFLFEILSAFRRDHPHIEIKLHTGDPELAITRILAGEEDIAIGARPEVLPNGLAFRPITTSPLVFIASRDHPQPDSRNWSATPMILSEGGLARSRIDAWFRARGVRPSIYAQVAGNEAIVSMVSLGFGIGVVPRIVLDNSPLVDNIRILDIRPKLKAYEVGLFALNRKLRNPVVEAFWSQLQ
jgi:LysR family positive regulator for ilvC